MDIFIFKPGVININFNIFMWRKGPMKVIMWPQLLLKVTTVYEISPRNELQRSCLHSTVLGVQNGKGREKCVEFLTLQLFIFLLAWSAFWVFHYPLSLPSQNWQKKSRWVRLSSLLLEPRSHCFRGTQGTQEGCAVACVFSITVLVLNFFKKNNSQIQNKFIIYRL